MKIEIYSFFSGLGLLDLGFENVGFDITFVDEINPNCLYAYKFARRHRLCEPRYGYSCRDIRDFLSEDIWNNVFPNYKSRKSIVGFIGGPPCPDFSAAGKNAGSDGKNGQLTTAYFELICKRLPDFFVFENVKGLYRTKKHREYYESIKMELLNSGYQLFDSIENALEYGAPQFRDRLFLIGLNKEKFNKNIEYSIGGNRCYDLKSILSVKWPKTVPYLENGELPLPTGLISELTVQYWFDKNDVMAHANHDDIFRIKNAYRYKTVPEGYTSSKSFKRLHRWRYSPTAAYGNNEVHLHPFLPRRLSVAEALAIQSLPKDFEVPKELPLSLKFKMVGNGVPYLLASGIAKELMQWFEKYYKEEMV